MTFDRQRVHKRLEDEKDNAFKSGQKLVSFGSYTLRGNGTRIGKWICNPLVPGLVPCLCPCVVRTVKGIIYGPMIPSPGPGAVPIPGPVHCE